MPDLCFGRPVPDRVSAKFMVQRMSTMSTSQLLRGAAQQVETNGWVCSECMDSHVHGSELSLLDSLFASAGWRSWYHDRNAPRDREQAEHRRIAEMSRLSREITANKKCRKVFTSATLLLMDVTGYGDLIAWNDRICGSKDEVLDVLTRAAELAESQGD